MNIVVYSGKGGDGKTPIATNIALDKKFGVCTNEHFHVFDGFINEDNLIAIKANEPFPNIPSEFNVVFDLAGSITENSVSITSALTQADLVIVPVSNEVKALTAGIGTIKEILRFTNNILIVATKLEKGRKELFGDDWYQSREYLNVKNQVHHYAGDLPVIPLKYSKVFNTIFEQEMSIRQIMNSDPLAKHNFKQVAEQFDEIYKHIEGVKNDAKQRIAKSA
ncbi:ParA family protein [Sessilibacter corallicola]|uniref:CobQ/CobB/MinD/ParA nucleotide binding domain-containing protein n=1 Tax=Sessilibacter corallicola TaxID=2904075 RepID=A0ABQ0AA74_9GAMM